MAALLACCPTLAHGGAARSCKLAADDKLEVRCTDGRVYEFDPARMYFKRNAIAAVCSYRLAQQTREDFEFERRANDLLHAARGEPLQCYEVGGIRERGKAAPLAAHPMTPVVPVHVTAPTCPAGTFFIDGECRKAKDSSLHADPRIAALIKRIAAKFYRSPTFACPGKDEFVALSGLNQVLTGHPIFGASMGVAVGSLVAPSTVDTHATGEDPELPVTCGFNNAEQTTFRASFHCRASGECYQQGDLSLPRDCEEFVPKAKGIGMQLFAHNGVDCTNARRFRNGGEEGDFVLRELGPGVYLKIVQDNWDDIFYHGLVFSKAPEVVDFWRTEVDESAP